MPTLPDITHLQFLVLTELLDGDRSGRDLREALAASGEARSGPAFYQFMARMEDAKLVEGRYEQKTVSGQPIKERWYHITATGLQSWDATLAFYRERDNTRAGVRPGLAGA